MLLQQCCGGDSDFRLTAALPQQQVLTRKSVPRAADKFRAPTAGHIVISSRPLGWAGERDTDRDESRIMIANSLDDNVHAAASQLAECAQLNC